MLDARVFVGHEVPVDGFGCLATFGDGDERLATAHVAGGEDTFHRGHVVGVCLHVAALIECHTQLLDHAVLDRAEEAHGEEDEIDIEDQLGAKDGFELWWRADADHVQLLHVAVLIAGELDAVDAPVADAAFFVGALSAELQRPERPGG